MVLVLERRILHMRTHQPGRRPHCDLHKRFAKHPASDMHGRKLDPCPQAINRDAQLFGRGTNCTPVLYKMGEQYSW